MRASILILMVCACAAVGLMVYSPAEPLARIPEYAQHGLIGGCVWCWEDSQGACTPDPSECEGDYGQKCSECKKKDKWPHCRRFNSTPPSDCDDTVTGDKKCGLIYKSPSVREQGYTCGDDPAGDLDLRCTEKTDEQCGTSIPDSVEGKPCSELEG